MGSNLGDLAKRLKKGIEADQDRQRTEVERRRVADARAAADQQEGQAARKELLAEILAFAKLVEHLDVRRTKGTVVIGFGGRSVVLSPEGDLDRIAMRLPDDTEVRDHHLTRDDQGEWEVAFDQGEHLRRLPLELGLEELMRVALHVPVDGSPDSVTTAPVPSLPTAQPAAPRVPTRTPKRGPSHAPPGSKITDLKGPLD